MQQFRLLIGRGVADINRTFIDDNGVEWPCLAITAVVVKRNKRLQIIYYETGEVLYIPPDFIKLNSRQPLVDLASKMVYYDDVFNHILEFESNYR